jgi:maltose alpha-D-glucosyltransferase / alpha-amylase
MSRREKKPEIMEASARATDQILIERDWYKDAIIYELHIKSFYDSNNDGIGDFAGLTEKLDYLQDLGVTAIWLLPFYPSPLRDDGYDIAEYKDVNPSYGTMADFKHFVREAHRRGLRVITELVINHTSDQHSWFQRARQAKPGSNHRDFYVWSDTDQRYQDTRVIFCDTETSNWTWDPVAQAYFWHRFYSHQPDLNFDNPAVVKAVINVMRFWLDLGVDGLRLDAVPYLVEREGTNNENLAETHVILRALRAAIETDYPDKMLLAEANQWPEDVLPYFGKGDECHMAFHFPLMPRIYMAVAQEDRHPITDIMRQTPDIPEGCQWAIFLRNHDELTLEMVTDRERDYLWDFYAGDRRMRINLGIRRRLAPLMQNDRRRIDLLNSILLSMPGTPVLYYGDEIGMGDNVYLGDRDGVRTPMQWSPDRNGGFSRADPARLFLPAVQDPEYGFLSVNVEAQGRSPTSMLNSMRRIMAVRRDLRSMGRGKLIFLYPHNRKVLSYIRCLDNELVLCVVNLSRAAQSVELDLTPYRGRVPVELLGLSTFPPIGDRPYHLTMQGHSFFWFKLLEPSQIEGGLAMVEAGRDSGFEPITLVLRNGWDDFIAGAAASELGHTVLRQFLPTQRWFAAKDVGVSDAAILDAADLPRSDAEEAWSLAIVETTLNNGVVQHYQMPLGLIWGAPTAEARSAVLPMTLAHVRRFRAEGALFDGGIHAGWALAVIDAIAAGSTVPFRGGGKMVFQATSKFADHPFPKEPAIRQLGVEQSNSSIAVQDYGVLKLYRRLEEGIHPEIEMCRFLTEEAGYAGTPALLGTVERVDREGGAMALGVLTGYVANQGDAWSYAQDHLKRVFQERWGGAGQPADAQIPQSDPHAYFLDLIGRLGSQTAELHRALCPGPATQAAFAPEPITPADLAGWRDAARTNAEDILARLATLQATAPDPAATALLDLGDKLLARIDAGKKIPIRAMKTRLHGDYHLGQVLVAQNDFAIIDFEGEPKRTMEDRRQKHTPLKDVAGMIRSIDYAAAAAFRAAADLPSVDNAALQAMCRDWRDRSTAAFMTAYRGTIDGAASWPQDIAGARALIDLMLIDKALYEVAYELAHRPAWLAIPIQGIVDLLTEGSSYV